MSKLTACIHKLVILAEEQGYLTFDNILEVSDIFSLSVSEVDKASESMQMRGIIVYETEPALQDKSDVLEDYSRVDYNAIFDEIISKSSNLKTFIDEVKELPPPQYGEVQALCTQVANGNEFAKNRLITIHIRNALRIALSLSQQFDYDIEDAISAGLIGLCIAVEKFDPNGFSAFQSYASRWIQQNIQRECRPFWMHYYYPTHYLSGLLNVYHICKEEIENSTENVNKDDFSESYLSNIAKQVDCDVKLVKRYLKHIKRQKTALELDDLIDSSEEPDDNYALDEYISAKSLKDDIQSVLESLSEKEARILKMRFGFQGNEPMTLEEVGSHFNVTRERIRQIEAKAMRKLRHPSRLNKLKAYY